MYSRQEEALGQALLIDLVEQLVADSAFCSELEFCISELKLRLRQHRARDSSQQYGYCMINHACTVCRTN